MKWKIVFLRLVSFLLLLVGLSALFSVLFSNSTYYLSGGFVGGIWHSLLSETLGQFAALLIAMICTVIGLYFCSVQSLLPILSQFYDWVMAKKEEQHFDEITHNLQNAEQNQPLVADKEQATAEIEEEKQPQFTDISAFTRPNISGLRQTMAETPNDSEMYNIERDLELPTININAQFETTNEIVEEQAEAMDYRTQRIQMDDVEMPTVRLNKIVENEIEPTITLINTASNETTRAQIYAENSLEEEYAVEDDINDTHEMTPAFMVTPPKMMKEVAEQTNYPKGYGETLIHPLLQRKVNIEKPTTPLPTLDLLDKAPIQTQQITEQEIRDISVRLESELANFGVKATVEDVLVGPVVTRYEIQPAAGVKAAKITNLASDIARALMFKAIRITEVIPNKPYMGIETPNKYRETVWLRDVLDSDEFRHTTATLPMALGKDISGNPVVVDMAKMPHLLVAGQTGGGKSVGVNTMILSLLFKLSPEQVRFIMIDPKVVELSIYNDIPHLLTPVVTDMKKAANALRWAVEEMERRYILVSHLQVRNIEGYNAKIDQAATMNLPIPDPTWRPGDSMDSLPPSLQKLSYIVLIVDEFADLMMSAGKEVEEYIMRIAQKQEQWAFI